MTDSDIPWFTATIARVPTNFSSPFRVAIQAEDREAACTRLYKLYSNDVYSGVGENMSEALSKEPVADPDILSGCRKHPKV